MIVMSCLLTPMPKTILLLLKKSDDADDKEKGKPIDMCSSKQKPTKLKSGKKITCSKSRISIIEGCQKIKQGKLLHFCQTQKMFMHRGQTKMALNTCIKASAKKPKSGLTNINVCKGIAMSPLTMHLLCKAQT